MQVQPWAVIWAKCMEIGWWLDVISTSARIHWALEEVYVQRYHFCAYQSFLRTIKCVCPHIHVTMMYIYMYCRWWKWLGLKIAATLAENCVLHSLTWQPCVLHKFQNHPFFYPQFKPWPRTPGRKIAIVSNMSCSVKQLNCLETKNEA